MANLLTTRVLAGDCRLRIERLTRRKASPQRTQSHTGESHRGKIPESTRSAGAGELSVCACFASTPRSRRSSLCMQFPRISVVKIFAGQPQELKVQSPHRDEDQRSYTISGYRGLPRCTSRLVSPKLPRPAVAPHPRSVSDMAIRNHAAADAGRSGHRSL